MLDILGPIFMIVMIIFMIVNAIIGLTRGGR
jgi:hypothetical protein